MLEDLIKYAKWIEKHSIRIGDELIHSQINKVVENFESKGLPRKAQTGFLTLFSAIEFSSLGCGQVYSSHTKDMLEGSHYLQRAIGSLVLSSISLYDLGNYLKKKEQKNEDGTITADIHSYSSLTGKIRPYAFLGSLGLMIHGSVNKDGEAFAYGMSLFPWSLSFYTRDDTSGGHLQKVKQQLYGFFNQTRLQPVFNPT